MIAFLDASALIYLIEGKAELAQRVRSVLAEAEGRHRGLGAALSRLTWLECRVGPLKRSDSIALTVYDDFFARPNLVWVDLTRDVVELATAIRVRHGLRTPDALQAASCLQLGSEHLFMTGDRAFRRVNGLEVLLLS